MKTLSISVKNYQIFLLLQVKRSWLLVIKSVNSIRVASQVAERFKIEELTKIGNIWEVLRTHGIIENLVKAIKQISKFFFRPK